MPPSTMTGAVLEQSGDRYSLSVRQVPVPPVGEGEVLVRVHAAGVTHMEESFLLGRSNERVEGLRQSLGQDVLTGIEFSGVAASDGVRIRKGDEVMGYIHILQDRRAHAQFTAVPEGALAPKPRSLTHVEAASMVSSCLTAYEALTKVAAIGSGSRLLVVGAAGGVGAHSVQLANYLRCHVTAMARPVHADRLKAMGADDVADAAAGLAALAPAFDVVLDTPPAYSFRLCEPLLKTEGVYINTLPMLDPEGFELAKAGSKAAGYLMVLQVQGEALREVGKLMEAGAFRPVIDRVYPLAEVQAAHERFSERGKIGKVVIEID